MWWGDTGAWTALALLTVTQTALALAHRGAPVEWGDLLAFGLVEWGTCAIFLPLW